MKLLIIDSLYSNMLKNFNCEIDSLQNINDRIFYLNYSLASSSSGYVEEFEKFGFETSNIYVNVKNLYDEEIKKNSWFNNLIWEKNNYLIRLGLTSKNLKSPSRLIYKKIESFKPNMIFIQDLNSISIELLKYMKSEKIILVGEIASKLPPLKFLKNYDLIFSALPQFVNFFRKNNIKSEYLPLAFNHKILNRIKSPLNRSIPVSFVGSISTHKNETVDLLKFLCKVEPNFRIYGIAKTKELIKNGLINNYYGEAFGNKMYEVLANSLITINRHISIAGDFAANLRLYESTGMGSYLITDYKTNLPLLLPKNTYSVYNPQNLPQLYNELAKLQLNRQETLMKAAAAQKHTLKYHTYFNRVEEIILHLNRNRLLSE